MEHFFPIFTVSLLQEVDKYIKKLTAKLRSFNYPEVKTLFDPFKEEEQLEQMIPNYRSHANNALANKKCTYKIVLGKTAMVELSYDLKYQVMKSDKDATRAGNGRVDTVILKRKPCSILPQLCENVNSLRKLW